MGDAGAGEEGLAANGQPQGDGPQPHNATAAAPARLADVVGLVATNAAAAWGQPERRALRRVCSEVRDAHDAVSLPHGLTINCANVAEGAEGARQLARLFGRPGCCPPARLVIRCPCMMYGTPLVMTAEHL